MKSKIPVIKFFILLLCTFPLPGLAQWESIEGPYGGRVWTLSKNDQYVYAGTPDGLFRSVNGKSWDGIPIVPGKRISCTHFDVLDHMVLAQVTILEPPQYSTALYVSKDAGNSWHEVNSPLAKIYGLYITDAGFYAFDFDSLWYSANEGEDWQPSILHAYDNGYFHISKVDRRIVVGATGKFYISDVDEDKFTAVSLPESGTQIQSCFAEDSLMLVMAPYSPRLYRSVDGGNHWNWIESERWYNNIYQNFVKIGDTIFLQLDSLVLKSADQG